jgi:ABC-type lipoprotein release transport system permease subunit
MILSPSAAVMTVCALVLVGIVTALLPARRAAELPPVEALRYEM